MPGAAMRMLPRAVWRIPPGVGEEVTAQGHKKDATWGKEEGGNKKDTTWGKEEGD